VRKSQNLKRLRNWLVWGYAEVEIPVPESSYETQQFLKKIRSGQLLVLSRDRVESIAAELKDAQT